MASDKIRIRGMMRGQLIDRASGKIVGDTGWGENKLTNYGLTNLALCLAGGGSVTVGYGALGTQTASINMTATDISHENSFVAVGASTSGTATSSFTCSFNGTANSATLTIGSFGLFKTNSAGSLIAARTYTSSQMTTAQNFSVTHLIQFATGTES